MLDVGLVILIKEVKGLRNNVLCFPIGAAYQNSGSRIVPRVIMTVAAGKAKQETSTKRQTSRFWQG
jgi:hypothetical protein